MHIQCYNSGQKFEGITQFFFFTFNKKEKKKKG